MTSVHVFDPAMCCSTGVCGPSVDPRLTRFAADLHWLEGQGVAVERFNLSQEPAKFAADAAVKAALEDKGEAALPVIKVNDEVRSVGTYPTRDELAAWAGVARAKPFQVLPAAASTASDCCAPTPARGEAATTKCC